eukprot:2454097-Amphidinium_carterae.2
MSLTIHTCARQCKSGIASPSAIHHTSHAGFPGLIRSLDMQKPQTCRESKGETVGDFPHKYRANIR